VAHCRQYWEIAERHSAVFTEIQELKEAASGSNVDAALKALKEKYRSVLTELDQHTSSCLDCKALERA
jgi:hypothetical protein